MCPVSGEHDAGSRQGVTEGIDEGVDLGPGMVKAALTLRTGNAWVHVWAYHALVPHTLVDTPLIVRVFGIR